jgi:hypothetical protein
MQTQRMWPILRDARKSALLRMTITITLVIVYRAQDNGPMIAHYATEFP